MSAATAFADLCAYSLQTALLLGVGLCLPWCLRFKEPSARLRYWVVLLYGSLALPLLPALHRSQGGHSGGATAYLAGTFTLVVTPGQRAFSPWPWVLGALGAVAAARIVWLGLGLLRLGAMRRKARPMIPLHPAVQAAHRRLSTEAAFLASDQVHTPLTFGWLRPTVLLPESAAALPREALRCIALHELLHVKRRHWLATLAEEALRSLLWFHPAVWLVLDRLALAREQTVDRQVIRLTRERQAYMETLAAMARARQGAAAVAFLPFFHRSHLLQRLALLSQEVSMSRRRLGLTVAALAGALLVTGAFAARAFPLLRNPQVEPSPPLQQVAEAGDPDEPMVYEMGNPQIKAPKLVKQVNPVYPEEAKEKGIAGRVVLSVVIDEKGEVLHPKVLKSVDPLLSVAAMEAVSQWRYETPMLKGQPVRVRWVITINFSLDP